VKLDDFLSHIFPNVNPDTQGVVATASKADGYQSRRWRPGRRVNLENLYFGVSTVRDAPRQDVLSRKTGDLVLSWVAVIDDVGTKVDPKLIKAKPTYRLLTSPGNEQWGFRYSYPIEPGQHAALMEAIAEAGLTDKGAIRADRIMRVPGSVNTKYGEPFAAALVEENWGVSYSWTELAVALDITVGEAKAASDTAPTLPEGETDPVFDWLSEAGMVFDGPNPRGWYAVRCPWRHLHTGDVDHGTDYIPGKPGAFKCLHGHCVDRTTSDLRAYAIGQGATHLEQQVDPGRLQALATALQPLRARVEASRPPAPVRPALDAPTGLAGRLAAHIRHIELWPGDLPDADRTPADQVNMRQATTSARVEYVMQTIGVQVRLNVITQQIEATLDGFDGSLTSDDVLDLLHHACVRCGMRDRETIRASLVAVAQNARYSPLLNWIEASPWDGKSRIQALCDSIVMRDIAMVPWRNIAVRRWLIQAVRGWRNYDQLSPAQISMCLVLQGAQGIGKSRWCKALLPDGWVTIGASLRLDAANERDVVKKATRTPLTELGELDATYKKSDTAALRNFLSTEIDTYRPPYGRTEIAVPRMTSFIASVNPEEFLVDQTGERRFLPLGVERCNPAHGIDLQQLWAEVAQIEEQHWLTDEEAEWHAKAAKTHKAIGELSHVLEDIELRKEVNADEETWIHVTPHEILTRYSIRPSPKAYGDLTSALNFVGFRMKTIRGRRGYYLPSLNASLTAAQQAGLRLVTPPKK
jgi:hypothetical protein